MISGWEWAVILVVIAAIILWGPKKIPELAGAIGKAKGEFDRTSREAMATVSPVKKTEESKTASSDDLLIETAKRLNISTEGKTKEEISKEILEKFKTEES